MAKSLTAVEASWEGHQINGNQEPQMSNMNKPLKVQERENKQQKHLAGKL